MAKFKLYTQVQLSKDLQNTIFKKGDIATVVEVIEQQNNTGYYLEFFDAAGNTIDIATAAEDELQNPVLHSVVNYRELVVA